MLLLSLWLLSGSSCLLGVDQGDLRVVWLQEYGILKVWSNIHRGLVLRVKVIEDGVRLWVLKRGVTLEIVLLSFRLLALNKIWVHEGDFSVIRLKEDWVLQVGSDVHGSLVTVVWVGDSIIADVVVCWHLVVLWLD